MSLPLLLWDVDDVLNPLTRLCWEDELRARFAPELSWDMLRNNPPLPELNLSRMEYVAELDRFRQRITGTMMPVPEVMAFFEEYGNRFRSIVVSAAPVEMMPVSAAWVLQHFGKWIQSTIFVPSPRAGVTVGSAAFADKSEAVLALNGMLIDDAEANVEQVRRAGGKAMLFPAPWNSARKICYSSFFSQLLKELDQ